MPGRIPVPCLYAHATDDASVTRLPGVVLPPTVVPLPPPPGLRPWPCFCVPFLSADRAACTASRKAEMLSVSMAGSNETYGTGPPPRPLGFGRHAHERSRQQRLPPGLLHPLEHPHLADCTMDNATLVRSELARKL